MKHELRLGPAAKSVGRGALVVLGLSGVLACASLPKGQYGVREIEWQGVDEMSASALEACLATKKRDGVTLQLGTEPTCGEPPFDEDAPRVDLWTWPWETWPVYDDAIFEVDRKRIERWYQARGFYEAKLLDVRYRVDDELLRAPERCTQDDCELELELIVEEGKPVTVSAVAMKLNGRLERELWEELHEELTLEVGERFDEAAYQADEERLLERLRDATYARAEVSTQVEINRVTRSASLVYSVTPGPRCTFGNVWVEGNEDLSAYAVLDVARLRRGEPYSESELRDAERAVYALGVFSSVKVEPRFDTDPADSTADLVIRVQPGRLERFRIGVGVMSGSLQRLTSDEFMSVPMWDVHLRIGYEHDSFLGDMRKLRIEDRPRLIMLRPFPGVPDGPPAVGNTLTIGFEQPRFPEHRTVSFATAQWDIGPDAFLGFFRHDLATRLGARREFFGGKLAVEQALQHDLYEITSENPPDTVSSYRLPFAEQQVRVDLRNDVQRPSRGVYVSNTLQEAVQLGYGSWDYLRWLAEARAYERLIWKVVLAQRVAFGGLFIGDAASELDDTSATLGPQNYRLRGGGANSNRGFLPGTLGAGVDGGKRRWEAALELRVPLGADFGVVLFLDAGDVNRGTAVRLSNPNTSTGFGLRYYTPFAPIRFDAGWRIPGWQRVGGIEPDVEVRALPSAAHLTIGEAF